MAGAPAWTERGAVASEKDQCQQQGGLSIWRPGGGGGGGGGGRLGPVVTNVCVEAKKSITGPAPFFANLKIPHHCDSDGGANIFRSVSRPRQTRPSLSSQN